MLFVALIITCTGSKTRGLRALLALAATLLAGVPARADDEVLLQILLQNKLITAEQYAAIKVAEAGTRKPPNPEQALLEVLLENGAITQAQFATLQMKQTDDKKAVQEAKVTMVDGLKAKSTDGSFTAQIGVYAQLDAAAQGGDGTDFSDGTELRRARLSVAGSVLRDWDYKLEAELAGTTQGGTTNNVTVTDAYARYLGFKPVVFTAGNFKVPFGLEAVSSGKYMTFMERGLPFAFLNLRALGAMVSTNGDNWTAAVGAFGDTVTAQAGDDEGKSVSGRVTWAPLFRRDRVLHLGASAALRTPADAGTRPFLETVRFRSKPEANLLSDSLTESASLNVAGDRYGRSSGRLVDTGNIPGGVDDWMLVGAEAAAVWGPLSLQGEYFHASVDRSIVTDLDFDGYYAYASAFLTGESRGYRADRGVFDLVVPRRPVGRGGWGAWEIAARISNLDLNDREVRGGELDNLTVALNWYPNPFVRVMANYIAVLDLDGGAHDGEEDLDVFQVRAQITY